MDRVTDLGRKIANDLSYNTSSSESGGTSMFELPGFWGILIFVGVGLFVFFMTMSGESEIEENEDAEKKPLKPLNDVSGSPDLENQWKKVHARYTTILKNIDAYETDLLLALRYPAMNDALDPITASMLSSLTVARDLMSIVQEKDDIHSDQYLLQSVSDAVYDLDSKFKQAEVNAKQLALSKIDPKDKKDFEQAILLLNHANDPGNPQEARQTYLTQLQKTIEGINERNRVHVIPEKALLAIEKQTRLALEDSSSLVWLK